VARPRIVDRDIGAAQAGFQHRRILRPERLQLDRQTRGRGQPTPRPPARSFKDTRAALIGEVRETRLVLPAAQFALTEEESADFAKKGARYPHRDASDEDPATDHVAGGDGGETGDPAFAPDDASIDLEEEDEDDTADRLATPQDANLEWDSGDLDDIGAPPIDTFDRAEAAYGARS